MTVSYFVRYDISPADREAFLENYKSSHVPILARWPGMRRVLLHTNLASGDSFPVNGGKAFLIAQLEFESQADLQIALSSPQRAEARRDFEQFPAYEGKVFHQAMAQEEVFRAPWVDGNEEGA